MKYSRFSLLAFALSIGSSGCAISYVADPLEQQSNTCSSDGDCGAHAVCNAGACVSTAVDLQGLIIEVRPNSSASFGASTSFLFTPDDAVTHTSAADGVVGELDSKLPAPVDVKGVQIKLGYSYGCKLDVGAVYPSKLTFERVTPFQGFHFDTVSFTPEQASAGGGTLLSPGVYNVYVEPQPIPGCMQAPPPPIFYPRHELTQGSPAWTMPKPLTLSGTIQIPNKTDLGGWRLDIVEPDVGRVISMTQTLVQDNVSFTVDVDVDFVWPDKSISPYIRLRPPEGVNKPTVYWDLLAALLGSSPDKPTVHLTLADLVVEPRPVEIQVQNSDIDGIPSEVKIQSVHLSGDAAANATFGLDILHTDPMGVAKVDLPPGTYRIRATPLSDDTLATTEADLDVPPIDPNQMGDLCYCGHVITVGKKATVSGRVLAITGDALVTTSIGFEPSQMTAVSFWSSVHALDPLLPRPASALSDAAGGFQIPLDPGESDLSVRPSELTGFPWLVQPRRFVRNDDTAVDLGDQRLSAPAILSGTFTDPTGLPLTNAYVRAWFPVRDPTQANGLAGTVIQIASTTTDAQGHYKLILPASVAP